MTIPTLMNQTGEAEYKAGLKKIISTLNQAVTMSVALNGIDFSSMDQTATTDSSSIYYMFTTRLNTMKSDGSITGNYTLYFRDGMYVTWPNTAKSCTSAAPCKMLIDVNGAKGPNTLSTGTNITNRAGVKDQFALKFFDQQVIPNSAATRYAMYDTAN